MAGHNEYTKKMTPRDRVVKAPCPACGRTFFLMKKSRQRHIEWENAMWREFMRTRHPDLISKYGLEEMFRE